MLQSLKIKNFRMLADFEISKLGNVNLIVGKNNSGKSSVLEALRIYAARGNPRSLLDIAISHDEISSSPASNEDGTETQQTLPFKDFFYGRTFPNKDKTDAIYIGDVENTQYISIDHSFYTEEIEKFEVSGIEETRRRRRIIPKATFLTEQIVAEQALAVSVSDSPLTGWIPLTDVIPNTYRRTNSYYMFWERSTKEIPASYVPTQFLSLDFLAFLWDGILFTPHADEVKNALKILDDDFEDIGFVKTSDEFRMESKIKLSRLSSRSDRTAVIKLKTSKTSIPLSSMGDGMLRVLQLALTIFPAKGGILLIDEFENGLHWSVQEKIWDMIFKLSKDLNIQVFATTHSDDAVKAFSKVASASPEEGVLIKLLRKTSDSGLDQTISVVYDEETLETATQAEVDVR